MATRQLIVEIIGDEQSLLNSFRRSSQGANKFERDIGKVSRGALAASVSVKGLGRSLAFASTSFLGGAGIAFAFKSIVNEASRVQEETEKTGVIFGKNAVQVQRWSQTLAQSFGVSSGAALEAAGQFGNMLRPLGFAPKLAAQMSTRLVELAADMASFNNTKPGEVMQALSAGLAGQVRPLRRMGVFLSQARIQTEALADGIARQGQKLTQAQKVQAAYNIILKDTRLQQGDVARNTESLSVATSKFTAGIQNLEAGLGKTLLPTITKYVNKGAEWLNQTQNQQRIQQIFAEAVKRTESVVSGLVDGFRQAIAVIRPTVDAIGGLRNVVAGLVAFKLARIVTGWLGSISQLGVGAKGAKKQVDALRLSMLKLGAIGVITLGVEVVLNRDKIEGQVDDFFRKHHLGFLATKKIKIPVDFSLEDALKTKAQLEKIGGNSIMMQFLDALIAKLKKAREEANTTITALAKIGSDVPRVTDSLDTLAGGGLLGPGGAKRGLTAEQRNKFFDQMIGRREDRVQDIQSLQGQLAALNQIAGLISQRLAKTKDITRRQTLEDDLLQVQRQQKQIREQLAKDFADSLNLNLSKAEATAGLKDDLKQLEAINANIRKQIRETGSTNELQQQLFENTQKIKATRAEQAQRQQFRALGLGPTGESLIPQRARLQKELGTISQAVAGTFLDTDKTRSLLERIRRVLSGGLGALSADVRAKIQEMLANLDKQLKEHKFKPRPPLDTQKMFAALGFDPNTIRLLQGRLTRISALPTPAFATAGVAPRFMGTVDDRPFKIEVSIDGHPVETTVTKRQQKRRDRNPPQRRG